MASDPDPTKPEDSGAELYDHEVKAPEGAGVAFVASFVFFGAGQLLKGHVKRFFALWGILVGLVGLLELLCTLTEPESAARGLSAIVIGLAIFLLWCYQLYDAVSRP
jgi:hypothetical protein